jgi:hypothetical protein
MDACEVSFPAIRINHHWLAKMAESRTPAAERTLRLLLVRRRLERPRLVLVRPRLPARLWLGGASFPEFEDRRGFQPAEVGNRANQMLWCSLAKEQSMAADSKNTRAQSRLEKSAREDEKVRVHYEVEAKTIAEKTARLRALRLAKEAADADKVPATSKKSRALKKRPKAGESLSEWLADQDKMGRRG